MTACHRVAALLLLAIAACDDGELTPVDQSARVPEPAASTSAAAPAAAPAGASAAWSTATTYEERKRNVEAALASGLSPLRLDIHDLGGWALDERKQDPFPEHIRKLEGKTVVLRGFMLPDLDFENIKKFHIVRSLWGCCFGAPPGPNEIVRVMLTGKGVNYSYKSLEVTGIFHLAFEMTDGLLDDIYRVEGISVTELGMDDPLKPASVTPEQQKKLNEFVPGGVEF